MCRHQHHCLFTFVCCLSEFLAHYSTSFVSTAGSQRMLGALSSQGLSRPASQGQRGWRRGRSHHRCAVHLQKAPPAPTANPTPHQSQTHAIRTLWWVWKLEITAFLRASSRLTEFCFSRLTSKLRRTQRLATGKNTSTLSSTPSVQPPQSKKRIPRNQQVAHPPLQMGRVRPPTHQQRSGLEKCLVRLLGKTLTTQR